MARKTDFFMDDFFMDYYVDLHQGNAISSCVSSRALLPPLHFTSCVHLDTPQLDYLVHVRHGGTLLAPIGRRFALERVAAAGGGEAMETSYKVVRIGMGAACRV